METYTYQRRKAILLISNACLFFVGLGIFLAGLSVEPAHELKFLRAELGRIFTIPKHILAFGFLSMSVSLYGIYGLWFNTTFYLKYGIAILCILSYELLIIATYLITQRIQARYINAEILEISGSASFLQYLRKSNLSSIRPYHLLDAEKKIENLRRLHSYFECCSGYKYNSWKPLFPNYICCKMGAVIPCSVESSYEDKCYRKLLIYAWKLYRYYVIICGIGFFFQSVILGVAIILYYVELIHEDAEKQK